MCTVSFVYSNNKIIITSNRDEQVIRPALEPKNYLINQKQVYFPKDPKAGGTWFAVDEHANVIVLLNGASEKHQWNPPYRKSRGLIVLDIIGATDPKLKWETIGLENIEPFTIVLYCQNELFQLRWNGVEKESVKLNSKENYIWSSSTLYPKNIRETRAHWFANFLNTKKEIHENELFDFHRYTEDTNKENGLVINRDNLLQTLSITQTVIEKNKVVVLYHDLLGSKETSQSFLIV